MSGLSSPVSGTFASGWFSIWEIGVTGCAATGALNGPVGIAPGENSSGLT